MKRMLLAALVCVTLLLSGCSVASTNIENTLIPPKLSQQDNEIKAALKEAVGSAFKLKYPQNGDYRSSFVIRNIDNEESPEAIVFYELPHDGVYVDSNVRINILDLVEGSWKSVSDYEGNGVGVDCVEFLKNVQNGYDIIIGYTSMRESEKLFQIYRYTDNLILLGDPVIYSSFQIADLDSNGMDDIFYIAADVEKKSTTASLLQAGQNGYEVLSTVSMKRDIISYSSIQASTLSTGQAALYIDGALGSNIYETEVVYYENGQLYNSFVTGGALEDIGRRISNTFCDDINEDGILEIPSVTLMPGYTAQTSNALYLVQWHQVGTHDARYVAQSYNDSNLGYSYKFPKKWDNKVSVYKNVAANEAAFYEYDAAQPKNCEIMRIKVVSKNEYKDLEDKFSYTVLQQTGQIMYLCRVVNECSEELMTSPEEIANNFKMIYS